MEAVVKAAFVALALTFPSLATAAAAPPGDGEPVDLELVLAVDISYSMDTEEQMVQRDGYAAALTSKPVLDAIAEGMLGKIAVAYVEWAGSEEQRTVVTWQMIDGLATAHAFADKLRAIPLRRAYRTSISGALIHSAKLFDDNGFAGSRQVIDLSGDGPNNQGLTVETVRDEIVERGVVINGLPLMLKRPNLGMADVGDLDVYYRDCVVGGPGAFVVPVREVEQFANAVRTKMVLEIAGLVPLPPSIYAAGPAPTQVQASGSQTSCTIGEQLWRDRFGN